MALKKVIFGDLQIGSKHGFKRWVSKNASKFVLNTEIGVIYAIFLSLQHLEEQIGPLV